MIFLNFLCGLQASVKKYVYKIFNEGDEIRPFKTKKYMYFYKAIQSEFVFDMCHPHIFRTYWVNLSDIYSII